jgi:hypothetical protein
MRNLTLKALVLTIVICFASLISKAQLGYNYSQFDAGFGGAMNQVYGDAESVTSTASVNFSLNFNQTPYLNYILEAQAGKLEGGNRLVDTTSRQFSNSFTAFLFRIQVQAGELIDYSDSPFANGLKNFYISSGIGYVVNNLRTSRYSLKIPNYYTPGEDHSNEIFIPARIGYEFKFYNQFDEPSVRIDLAYQYNFVMGDELDGFNTGHQKDAFSQISLGIKFAIGSKTSYRKQITY